MARPRLTYNGQNKKTINSNVRKGHAIPSKYIPAVDRGIQEAAVRGILAGCPVVDFKV